VIVAGGGGKDLVSGQGGNDTLCGEARKDKLNGGKGKDKLNGGKGKDKCIGGGISKDEGEPGVLVIPDGVKDTGKSCEKEKLIP
jgi:Ca2+-binding RTX toxin-like protein